MQIHHHPASHQRLAGALYDSAVDTWTTYYEDTTLESIYRSVYVNGCMHYIGSKRSHLPQGVNVSRRHGVSFDLFQKVFSKFEAPLASEVGAKKFMKLHRRLALVLFSTVASFRPSVLQLVEQTQTWVDVYLLPLGANHGVDGHVPLGMAPFFTSPTRKPIWNRRLLQLAQPGALQDARDLHGAAFRKLHIIPPFLVFGVVHPSA